MKNPHNDDSLLIKQVKYAVREPTDIRSTQLFINYDSKIRVSLQPCKGRVNRWLETLADTFLTPLIPERGLMQIVFGGWPDDETAGHSCRSIRARTSSQLDPASG